MRCLLLFLSLLSACQTVTVKPGGGTLLQTPPDFEVMQTFWLGGLLPEESYLDVSAICAGEEPEQMQTQFELLDGFLTLVTVSIISPRTAKIWCHKRSSEARLEESP